MVSNRQTPVNSELSDFRLRLGVRIRAIRARLGMSQEKFGAIAGVGKIAQLNYEKGSRVPDAEYLDKLARHGVPVEYLLPGAAGERFQKNRLDTDLLAAVIKAVGTVSRTRGHALSEEDFAIASASLYELLVTERSAGQSVEQAAAIMLAGWSASRKVLP